MEPPAVSQLVINGAVAAIVMTSVALPVPAALVALIATFVVAAAAGVPLIKPVDGLSVSPEGRPIAL